MISEDFLLIHPYFYTSKTGFTHPNDGWTGLCLETTRTCTVVSIVISLNDSHHVDCDIDEIQQNIVSLEKSPGIDSQGVTLEGATLSVVVRDE